MAQYTERLWTQTKDTEQLTFVAGVDLPFRELVKESAPNSDVMIIATASDAIGYVISPKGALAGQKVDIQMLYGSGSGGSGSLPLTTNSITGDGQLGTEIQLVNDQLTPGVLEYYGTDASGTKGFYSLPSGSSGVNTFTPGTNVTNTGTASDPIANACTTSLLFQGVITDTITSDINNWNPAGLSTASKIVIEGAGNFKITGLQGGSDGRFLILQNNSSAPITLSPADVLSLPQNWFLSEANIPVVIENNGIAILTYQAGIVNKWYVLNRANRILRIDLATAQSYQTPSGGSVDGQMYEIIDPPAPFTSFYTWGIKDPSFLSNHLANTGYGYINTVGGQLYAEAKFDDSYTNLVECYIPQFNIKATATSGYGYNCITQMANLGSVTISNCIFDDCNLEFNSFTAMISDCNFRNANITMNSEGCTILSTNVTMGLGSGVNTEFVLEEAYVSGCTIAFGTFDIKGQILNSFFGQSSDIKTEIGCLINSCTFENSNIVQMQRDCVLEFSTFDTNSNLKTLSDIANLNSIVLENGASLNTGPNSGSVYVRSKISNCVFTGPQNLTDCYINNYGNSIDASTVTNMTNVYVDWQASTIIFPAFDIANKTITLDKSTYEYDLDITGLTSIDMTTLGYDWVGVWNLTSSNSTETISQVILSYADSIIDYTFKPITSGLDVTFTTTTSALAGNDDILLEGGSNITLQCQACNGGIISDFLVLKRSNNVNRSVHNSLLP